MKSYMKLIIGSLLLLPLLATAQINTASPSPAFTTNFTITGATNIVLLSRAAKISQVQVIGGAGTASCAVNIFDNDLTNTAVTNAAYTNIIIYPTNQVITYISPLTGTTNTQTNSFLYETNVLFAQATNNLPYRTFVSPAGVMATYSVNMINNVGIMLSTTSTNGMVVITYRIND